MEAPKKYQMNISNTVLYHLGINLYSNVPAVLSEVVANSWDADAANVYIEIEKDRITIIDDGHGMTLKDIKGALNQLERISLENIPAFMEILSNFDDIEASLYYQIIQERLRIISKLHNAVEDNAVEKTIQEILYEHLWLLDPSWDRATETTFMEQTVQKEFEEIETKEILTDPELNGRYDIKYKMTAGKHVIIELKRANRKLDQYDLLRQVEKYGEALRKIVRAIGKNEPVETVCLVGKDLVQWSDAEQRERSKKTMEQQNVRVVLYHELIEDAYRTYNSFLELHHEHGRVYRLVKNLEIQAPEVD